MDDLTKNRYLPFPETDFDKNGNLKKVRPRMLKKLLKYEFKNTFKTVGVAAIVYMAVAAFICAFGFLSFQNLEREVASEVTTVADLTMWILGIMLLVYGALFLTVFPLITSFIRYGKTFFRSQGYLTHSIPATPEEQILSKRICAFSYIFAAQYVALVGIILAFLPLFVFHPDLLPLDVNLSYPQAIIDALFLMLYFPISIWTAHSVCGFVRCWFHRGLKVWAFILMLVGGYFATLYATVSLSYLLNAENIVISPLAVRIIAWVVLAGWCVLNYFIFRFEAQTLRKRINLK